MHPFQALKRYWHLLARYLLPQWPQMLLLLLILGCTISVQVVTPLVASRFIDGAAGGDSLHTLVGLALVTMLLAVIGQAAAVAETYVAESVSWTATNALRADLLAHLLRLDAAFHHAHTPGELIERVDGDVSTLARFFSRFVVYVLGNGILMLGVLGLLWAVDWKVGITVSALVALAMATLLRIRASALPSWAAERQASAEYYGFLGEHLSGLEDIRSSGAGAYVLRRCAEVMRSWLAATRKAQMRGYAMIATSQGLFALGIASAFAMSAMLYREGSLTIGTVYLVFQYTELLRRPTEQIRNEIQELQQADAGMGRVEALLSTSPRLQDATGGTLAAGPLSVQFEDVTFGYSPETAVLKAINLRLEPGRVLGIVGRTGSGKTTLTRLLPRFYEPTSGVVRLGGVDVRTVPLPALRARLGLVTQEIQLFNASIRDNLTLFDDQLSDEHIGAVLDSLGLGPWLRQQPRGLDTELGHGGAALSAGQAQILACARVFLRDPSVVILDEASSRLDPATERRVHEVLGTLLAGRTGIIVAHRLSTVAYADDILVLENGQVREYGSREGLSADPSSRFSELLRVAAEEASI